MNAQTFELIQGKKSWVGLGVWLIVTFSASSMGVFFMPDAWYAGLNKPTWNPPNWVFGPVWSLLYTMMAISAWLIWRQGGFSLQRRPLILFLIQLFLNAAWTPLFFGWHLPAIAFGEIVFLWLAIVLTMVSFFRVSLLAGWLLMPYLIWVSFAAVLNFTLWKMN